MSNSSKVVLVTGCSKGGIGYSLYVHFTYTSIPLLTLLAHPRCEEYAARGCTVYATARTLSSMSTFTSPNIHPLQLDVLSDSATTEVISTILFRSGKIDILVNNAGVMAAGPVLDQTVDSARKAFETNVFSILRLSKAVVKSMADRKSGTIVNIGSIVGEVTTPWNGMYSATKAAVHMITDTLWMECQPLGINVVLVAPGAIRSNISNNQNTNFHVPDDSLYKDYVPQILRRIVASQGKNSMDTGAFAKVVVGETMKRSPRRYVTLGGNSGLFRFFGWLPRTFVLWLLWRIYSRR